MGVGRTRLPRVLSTVETWGFGFTVLLFWVIVGPEVHGMLGNGSLLVWAPAVAVGILIILQVRRLALANPELSGGSPSYVARLWEDRPLVARWAGLAYFHSWAIVPPALSWILADLVVVNLAELGQEVGHLPIQLGVLGAFYVTALSGIRVLSVVHLLFLVPSLGLLLLFGMQGTAWVLGSGEGGASAALAASTPGWSGWSAWLSGYFVVAYTAYGAETAAAFTADARNPKATIRCLLAAAILLVPIMVGGSWLLAAKGAPDPGLDPFRFLEEAALPFWGGFAPVGVTFMVASSMLLASATSVAIAPRVAWQMSRDGRLPPFLGRLDASGVPQGAVLLAAAVGILHLGLDPVNMILVGGSSWVAFWMLMHLGIWRRRGDPVALLPTLALGFAVVEGAVLFVGGTLSAGRWLLVGLAFPTFLLALSRVPAVAAIERPMSLRTTRRVDGDAEPQTAREIALLAVLILVAVGWGWWIAGFAAPGSGVAANRVLVVSVLISTFMGVAWASWTSLRKLDLLARARSRASALLASAADAVVVTDGEGRIVSANPAASHFFGIPQRELPGRLLGSLVSGLEGLPSGWKEWTEYPVQASGGTRIAEVAGREALGSGGSEFTVTLRDVTERKEAENALRSSEERLDLALDVTRASVWDVDVPTGAVFQSPQWARMIGEEGGQGPWAKLSDWKERLHPDDREPALRALETHLRGESEAFESEHRIRAAGGRWLWVFERGSVVERDADGAPLRMVGTTVDVSERKALELRLLQSQKMEAVGQLAGGVAHDFNNVLTAILGTSEFLLDGETPLTPEQERDVRDIFEAGLRAREITHHLLAFSRRQQLMPRVVAPDEVLRRTERLLSRLLNDSIRLEIEIEPGVGWIRTDPGQLEQAVVNLVVNARDAMPEGGTVTVAAHGAWIEASQAETAEGVRPGPAVALSVTDTGVGMDPATRARAFEPFFTTKAPGAGTGLGLAMVYGFVRQSGGIVEVESRPGAGTTVRLIFPREEPHPPP